MRNCEKCGKLLEDDELCTCEIETIKNKKIIYQDPKKDMWKVILTAIIYPAIVIGISFGICNELAEELDEVEPFIEDYYPKIEIPVTEEKEEVLSTEEEKPMVKEPDKKPTKNKQQYINYNPYYYYPYPYGYNNYYMNYYRSYKNPKKRSR